MVTPPPSALRALYTVRFHPRPPVRQVEEQITRAQ